MNGFAPVPFDVPAIAEVTTEGNVPVVKGRLP